VSFFVIIIITALARKIKQALIHGDLYVFVSSNIDRELLSSTIFGVQSDFFGKQLPDDDLLSVTGRPRSHVKLAKLPDVFLLPPVAALVQGAGPSPAVKFYHYFSANSCPFAMKIRATTVLQLSAGIQRCRFFFFFFMPADLHTDHVSE
jgi:hypothetical protein